MTGNDWIAEPLCFPRVREVVPYQRFGECLKIIQGVYNGRSSCSCRNARRRRPDKIKMKSAAAPATALFLRISALYARFRQAVHMGLG